MKYVVCVCVCAAGDELHCKNTIVGLTSFGCLSCNSRQLYYIQ